MTLLMLLSDKSWFDIAFDWVLGTFVIGWLVIYLGGWLWGLAKEIWEENHD